MSQHQKFVKYKNKDGQEVEVGRVSFIGSNGEMTSAEFPLYFNIADISSSSTSYIVAPFSGTLSRIYGTRSASTTGTAALTLTSPAGSVTGASTLQMVAGTGAIDIALTTNTDITAGEQISLATDGGSTNVSVGSFCVLLKRSS